MTTNQNAALQQPKAILRPRATGQVIVNLSRFVDRDGWLMSIPGVDVQADDLTLLVLVGHARHIGPEAIQALRWASSSASSVVVRGLNSACVSELVDWLNADHFSLDLYFESKMNPFGDAA